MAISQNLERINPRADFGLRIEFNSQTPDPGRIFRAFSGLINFCQSSDRNLLESLDISIEPVLLLENIEEGSIIVWLRTLLESIDDQAIKELNAKKLIGSYLVRAKYVIIDFINKRTTITSSEEIVELQAELVDTAQETQVSPLGIYTPPPARALLENIEQLQSAVSELQSEDRVYYLTQSTSVPINLGFNVSPETIEDLMTRKVLKSETEMILKVKKPDYLGNSKWSFKHDKRIIEVKITDEEWLKNFRTKKFFLGPGDAIQAIVESVTRYDVNYEVISTQYTVKKIVQNISVELGEQGSLLEQELEVSEDDDKRTF